MKTNLPITLVVFFLLTSVITGTALAQTTFVGVSPGNTFDYSYKINWSSTNPAAIVPATNEELNNTQFIRISVITVTGSLINVDFTRHFNNGTEQTQNGNIDVNSQILEIPYSVLIIRANANPGEKIYPAGGHSTLSDTATRTYSIGQIQTIRYAAQETSGSSSQQTEIFYDKSNGVGVEYNAETQETSGAYVTTTKETLIITSMIIPEFPSAIIFVLVLATIPIVLFAYKKKELSSRKFAVTLKK